MTQTMSQHVDLNLPIQLHCLRVPTSWTRKSRKDVTYDEYGAPIEYNRWTYEAKIAQGEGATYDPWAMRTEFLRINRDDHEVLLGFLNKIGQFDRGQIEYSNGRVSIDFRPKDQRQEASMDELAFWTVQRWIGGEMLMNNPTSLLFRYDLEDDRVPKEHTLNPFTFDTHFMQMEDGRVHMLLETRSFFEAVVLSISIDRAKGAKVRKCVRPDCPGLFSVTGNRAQQYCCWNCAHLEAVRRQRKKKKDKALAAAAARRAKSLEGEVEICRERYMPQQGIASKKRRKKHAKK